MSAFDPGQLVKFAPENYSSKRLEGCVFRVIRHDVKCGVVQVENLDEKSITCFSSYSIRLLSPLELLAEQAE